MRTRRGKRVNQNNPCHHKKLLGTRTVAENKDHQAEEKGSVFWTFFGTKQIRRWRAWSFKEKEDVLSCKQSAASEWRKEIFSRDIQLSGNVLLFIYCMTEILLVLALSRLWTVLDSQTSSTVVPNHHYKPDPSPVCSKAQQPHRTPATHRGFIGFCSSSYCTRMDVFSHLTKFSFRSWHLKCAFLLFTRNRMILQHRSVFFHLSHWGSEVGLGKW